MTSLSLAVVYQHAVHPVSMQSDSTVLALKQELCLRLSSDFTSGRQMRLISGGRLLRDDDVLRSLKLDRQSKITLLRVDPDAVGALKLPRHQQTRVVNDLDDASAKKRRPTASSNTQLSARSRFKEIQVLNLPMADRARAILTGLANDDGVIAVMEKHGWTVGALAELYPEGQVGVDPVCVLGLNENAGQRILLRIRTDDLEGFRDPLTVRKTLYHELAHNEVGDHNDDFYRLMRQVEKEVRELDWRRSSAHTTSGASSSSSAEPEWSNAAAFNPSQESEAPKVYTLGGDVGAAAGGGGGGGVALSASARAGLAALQRRSREELEMEASCGCSSPPSSLPFAPPPPPLPSPALQQAQAQAQAQEQEQEQEQDQAVCLPCAPNPERPAEAETAMEEEKEEEEEEEEEDPPRQDWQIICEAVLAQLDDGLSLCLSSESGGAPVEKMLGLRDCLQRIFLGGGNDAEKQDAALAALQLVRLIIGNAKELNEDKYRQVSTGSAAYSKIKLVSGSEEILRLAGFGPHPSAADKLLLSARDVGLLHLVYGLLDEALLAVDRASWV